MFASKIEYFPHLFYFKSQISDQITEKILQMMWSLLSQRDLDLSIIL